MTATLLFRRLRIVVAALMCVACVDRAASVARQVQRTGDSLALASRAARRLLPAAPETVWAVSGATARDDLRYPVALTVGPSAVYVLDAGLPGLVAFSRADGRVLWRHDGSANGWRDPRAIARTASGELLVATATPSQLLTLTPEGTLTAEWRAELFAKVTSLCDAGEAGLLATTPETDTSLYSLDTDRRAIQGQAHPIPGLRDMHRLTRQGRLSGSSASTCSFLTTLGSEFALLGTAPTPHPYVERLPPVALTRDVREDSLEGKPATIENVRVDRPKLATMAGWDEEGCLYVLFEGQSDVAGRALDAYRRDVGSYTASLELPGRIGYFAISADTIFAVARVRGLPLLLKLAVDHPLSTCLAE